MANLLTLATKYWQLNVWAKDISAAQTQLHASMQARNLLVPPQRLRLSGVDLFECSNQFQQAGDEIALASPLFFENQQYSFEFVFTEDCANPEVCHALNSVRDAFHFSRGALVGMLNFANDIGWFRLPLRWQVGGSRFLASLSIEVLPTKMNMAADLQSIHQQIDQQYPLWRFSFARKTDQELAQSSKPHERFPLLWLAHFSSLRHELELHLTYIRHAPQRRLKTSTRRLPLARIRGRMGAHLEQAVAQARCSAREGVSFQIENLQLASDTLENRFIKMVLQRCLSELARFVVLAKKLHQRTEADRLSPAFFDELARWQQPLRLALGQPLFAQVGEFEGEEGASLVLQQRAGYSGVYRVWQQLKLYLDVFAQQTAISIKSVADLYEVWCLLEVRRQLIALGFREVLSERPRLRSNGLEKTLRDGLNAAFVFQRGNQMDCDCLTIRLAHEPIFSKPKEDLADGIYSWHAQQKPDILLEASFPNGEQVMWIFDAKYRIASPKSANNTFDRAPEDAINQMHRYRDALIYLKKTEHGVQKTRPIIGACVLYPGWFAQDQLENPYAKAIEEIGIGAIAVLPGMPNFWLAQFLQQHFGSQANGGEALTPDQHLTQSAARIPTRGMQVLRYSDLALLAELGSQRSEQYLQMFDEGKAAWYHMPLSTLHKQHVSQAAMQEIKHCALAVNGVVSYVYAVKSVRIVLRKEITAVQSGTIPIDNQNAAYCLFELGKAERLQQAIASPRSEHFQWKLSSSLALFSGKTWQELPERYTFLQDS